MIVGWDISTSAIGICVRDDDGKVIEFGVIYPSGSSHAEKHKNAASQVVTFCKRICNNARHYVEERLGGFTGGFTSAQTLMALSAMNAVISFVLSDFGPVTHIAPASVNRIVKFKKPKGSDRKEEVVKLVRSLESSFPYEETIHGNPVKGTDDMADAWMLSEAGLRVEKGLASLERSTKVASNNSKARAAKIGSPKKGRVRIPLPEQKV